MPATALAHFREDIARARAIVDHAASLPGDSPGEQMLQSDFLRSAWMFAVGALDAYFCDAYSDLLAVTIISKNRHEAMVLPHFFYEIRFPVRAIIEKYPAHDNWKWRMAARRMMDRESVLSLKHIQDLFNKYFRDRHKLFGDLLESWINDPAAKKRLFGINQVEYQSLDLAGRSEARKDAKAHFFDHFQSIFQRRHDCIHNCDRPKMSPQPLKRSGTVIKVIDDIVFLVEHCNEHIHREFHQFLLDAGCPAAVAALAGY